VISVTTMTVPYKIVDKSPADSEEVSSEDLRGASKSKNKTNARDIVFSTRCKYGCFIWGILIFSVAVCVLTIIPISLDPETDEQDKEAAIHTLIWSAVAIIILYMFILPVSVEVRSDASIGVKTLVLTYSFIEATRAYRADSIWEGVLRPRIKFATSLDSRVIVRRKHGWWDLALSPHDADGFIRALADVAQQLEFGEDVAVASGNFV
jgi:hypothetical protein